MIILKELNKFEIQDLTMKKILTLILISIICIGALSFFSPSLVEKVAFGKNLSFDTSILKEGDVIFQTSNYGQSLAVQKATGSKYSHVGILFQENREWYVYEAVQPVQKITLKEFISHGDQNHFTISRLKETGQLNLEKIKQMKSFFKKVEGLDYDIYFEWSDKTWYCLELVWKMYNHVGISISEYEKFGQYNLKDPVVVEIINQRFKNGVNKNETVITPRGISESPKMIEIYTNY
jgi:hypothetical protein